MLSATGRTTLPVNIFCYIPLPLGMVATITASSLIKYASDGFISVG